jgi:alkylated DNA repair dioxygenase AlkB
VNIYYPRTDFLIVEDYFTPLQAHIWLKAMDDLGRDERCGYHHPHLRPNRFHKTPRYPVKKFMCLGLYWNPLDYLYHEKIPGTGVRPHPIPEELKNLSDKILKEFYPTPDYVPQSVMVNFYTKDSSMGLHVDKDEPNKTAPIIGLNFGSACRFFFENEGGEIKETRIPGNSIYVFGKSARLMRHGLGTIFTKSLSPGSETFLQNKERLNLTIRQVFYDPRSKD